MREHRPDPLAAVAGVVFLVVAAVSLLGAGAVLRTPGVLPGALVLVGGAGLVSGWLSRRSDRRDDRQDDRRGDR